MAAPVAVSASRSYTVDVARAFAITMPVELARIFTKRVGPLPAVVGIKGQDGEWSTVGQTRWVQLGDGSQMQEEITAVDPGHSFEYRLTEPSGPMKLLVDHVEGRWDFVPTPSGASRVTWSWQLYPRSPLVVPVLLIVGSFWRRYAAHALAELAPILQR